jgi:hypothetical protein
MGADELRAIEGAAAAAGVNVSEYIRRSALVRSEAHWQGLISTHVGRLLGEVRALEEALQGVKDAIPEAFNLANDQEDRASGIAEEYRASVDARLDDLIKLRESLDEFWRQSA